MRIEEKMLTAEKTTNVNLHGIDDAICLECKRKYHPKKNIQTLLMKFFFRFDVCINFHRFLHTHTELYRIFNII